MTTHTLSEGEKLARVPGIIYVDGPAGRRAGIVGGMDVFELIGAWLSANRSVEWLLEAYPWMTREMIQAGLDFYTLFPEEIDARLAREWEISRRLEAAEKITPELIEQILADLP